MIFRGLGERIVCTFHWRSFLRFSIKNIFFNLRKVSSMEVAFVSIVAQVVQLNSNWHSYIIIRAADKTRQKASAVYGTPLYNVLQCFSDRFTTVFHVQYMVWIVKCHRLWDLWAEKKSAECYWKLMSICIAWVQDSVSEEISKWLSTVLSPW